ncbi:UNVERIFIED_CONTAM: hypothetical protein Scaly_1334200 [Sesamum calycinum]|uniref:DUF4283 domain-containing protein n=1 Tax=Sesamum calycinum TaxID=2727403 RepID=A0AAW2PMV9_9LAMI
MRVFKWSPTFTPDQESSIVPVWVNFSELPAHLFYKDAIFSIASIVGTPLQMADSTYNQSKFSWARVCIEIDLLKPLLEDFDIQIEDRKIIQKIEYEKIPHYCSLCKHVGHQALECYSKGKMAMQPACKLFDKRLARKEPTVLERGECSKTAEERHRYASIDLLNEDLDNNFQSAAENEIAHSSNYVVTTDIEICRKDGENVGVGMVNVENDVVVHANRSEKNEACNNVTNTTNGGSLKDWTDFDAEKDDELYVVHEKETENLIPDSIVNVETVEKEARKDIIAAIEIDAKDPLETVHELEESQENIVKPIDSVGTLIIRPNNFVCDLMRGKKRIKKCVLLYDPVRQMNLKPLDTGEHLRQQRPGRKDGLFAGLRRRTEEMGRGCGMG